MLALDYFLRMRNGIVGILIVIAVAMYLLPPAYLMVQNTRTGMPVAELIWQTSGGIFNLFYWFPAAGIVSVCAVILHRAKTVGKQVALGFAASIAWFFLIVCLETFLMALLPGPVTYVLGTLLLAYPPYFALRWLLRDECQFSGSLLEHLAFVAAFGLPLLFIGFSMMFDPKYFDFYF
ncbi:MAG: hypothetical protein KAH11_03445 [Rhodospirillales bacterium]|nr:hypothetical protein [Rhodospirillales bacterium]